MRPPDSPQPPSLPGPAWRAPLPDATVVSPFAATRRARRSGLLHPLLFLATLATTVAAGMVWEGHDPLSRPDLFYHGLPYAATLMAILLCHEMGHYLTARYYGMDVTLPYFIPSPILPVGTFGAFIRMKSAPLNRRVLLYVAAAGPIAGFCVALPAMFYGYSVSEVVSKSQVGFAFELGEPLLLQMISQAVVGALPPESSVSLNSVGMAAWFGILVTMFNLLPMGQLDGGHIVYAFLGSRARYVTWGFVGGLVAMGLLIWEGWLVWAVIGFFVSRRHPTVVNPYVSLDRRSRVVACLAFIILVLCFMPLPIQVVSFSP